jgi:hypothetical protein
MTDTANHETERTIAETLKLVAEEAKLNAERHKLEAERQKLRADTHWHPILVMGPVIGAIAAAVTVAVLHYLGAR